MELFELALAQMLDKNVTDPEFLRRALTSTQWDVREWGTRQKISRKKYNKMAKSVVKSLEEESSEALYLEELLGNKKVDDAPKWLWKAVVAGAFTDGVMFLDSDYTGHVKYNKRWQCVKKRIDKKEPQTLEDMKHLYIYARVMGVSVDLVDRRLQKTLPGRLNLKRMAATLSASSSYTNSWGIDYNQVLQAGWLLVGDEEDVDTVASYVDAHPGNVAVRLAEDDLEGLHGDPRLEKLVMGCWLKGSKKLGGRFYAGLSDEGFKALDAALAGSGRSVTSNMMERHVYALWELKDRLSTKAQKGLLSECEKKAAGHERLAEPILEWLNKESPELWCNVWYRLNRYDEFDLTEVGGFNEELCEWVSHNRGIPLTALGAKRVAEVLPGRLLLEQSCSNWDKRTKKLLKEQAERVLKDHNHKEGQGWRDSTTHADVVRHLLKETELPLSHVLDVVGAIKDGASTTDDVLKTTRSTTNV